MKINGIKDALPITFEPLSDWVTKKLQLTKPETVTIYISGLKSKHIDHGYSTEEFNDPRIKRLLQGGLCLFGTKPIRDRGDITRPLLLSMVRSLNIESFDDLNLAAAFCVAFAAFLQPSEFT